MNDPFGIARFQKAVQQTQKAVASVNVVATKLSQDAGNSKALDSIANATKAATTKLDQIETNAAKAKDKVAEVSDAAQTKKHELENFKPLADKSSS